MLDYMIRNTDPITLDDVEELFIRAVYGIENYDEDDEARCPVVRPLIALYRAVWEDHQEFEEDADEDSVLATYTKEEAEDRYRRVYWTSYHRRQLTQKQADQESNDTCMPGWPGALPWEDGLPCKLVDLLARYVGQKDRYQGEQMRRMLEAERGVTAREACTTRIPCRNSLKV